MRVTEKIMSLFIAAAMMISISARTSSPLDDTQTCTCLDSRLQLTDTISTRRSLKVLRITTRS